MPSTASFKVAATHLVPQGHCPSCGAKAAARSRLVLSDFDVHACRCGIKFIDPSLDEQGQISIYRSSGSLAEINPSLEQYYEYKTLDPKSRTARDYKAALDGVEKATDGNDLFEIGCGAGGFLQYAKIRGWNVSGIDSSPENIKKTKEKGLEALQGNIFEYASSSRFDVIVLWDVLEHPQDPGKLLEKCRGLLKPGGCLLIAVPHDPNIISLAARMLYVLSLGRITGPAARWYVMEHTSYFSIRGLCGLLERHGFSATRWWKTETDLSRYKFGFMDRFSLGFLFALARMLGFQNRLVTIAQKSVLRKSGS